jgi:hypothetical protein
MTKKSRGPRSSSIQLLPQAMPLNALTLGMRLLNLPASHIRSHRYSRVPRLKAIQTLMMQLYLMNELGKYMTKLGRKTLERYYDISVTGYTTTGHHILHDFTAGTARMAISRGTSDDVSMAFTITVQGLDTDEPFLRFTPRDGDHIRLATEFWKLHTCDRWGIFYGELQFGDAIYDFEQLFGTGSHSSASKDRLEGFDMQPAILRISTL